VIVAAAAGVIVILSTNIYYNAITFCFLFVESAIMRWFCDEGYDAISSSLIVALCDISIFTKDAARLSCQF
jgi:hypothetical protein